MDKKKKMFIRVLCFILALIMTLSVVVPTVFAAEVETEAPYLNGEGFEYVEQNGEWIVQKTGDAPVIKLSDVPATFERDNLPLFLVNISTFKVHTLNLLEVYGYAEAIDLEEGYYLIYTSSYAWEDNFGAQWAVNGADTFYFYHGDASNFENGKYDLEYETADGVFEIPLEKYTDGTLPVAKSNETIHLENEDKIELLNEIHNWDEMQDRLEHLDLEATLEEGHPVYEEGYVPNSTDTSETNTENTTDVNVTGNAVDTNNTPNLGELASGGVATNENDTELPEVPIAQPEIIETKPADAVQSDTASDNETTQPSEQNTLEDVVNNVYEQIGIEPPKQKTVGEYIWEVVKNSAVYVVLLGVVVYFYIKIKNKEQEDVVEQLDDDKYDDSHIL